MPMTRLLKVLLRGEMTQAKLERLRELLDLKRRGRLTDTEDAEFGYRYTQRDKLNRVDLTLWRADAVNWHVALDYTNEPPPAEVVEQCRADILTAAKELGFTVEIR